MQQVQSNLRQPLMSLSQYFHDDNEQICFLCRETGELRCCDNCFRAYHANCKKTLSQKLHISTDTRQTQKSIEEMNKQQNDSLFQMPIHRQAWTCELCLIRQGQLCGKCYKKVENNHLICSACYRLFHHACTDIPKCLTSKQIMFNNTFGNGWKPYVCIQCFHNCRISNVILLESYAATILAQSNLYHNPPKFIYALLNTPSPIHIGWLNSDQLETVAVAEANNIKERQVEQIILMKIPLSYESLPIHKIYQTLMDKNRKNLYGDTNNFKFLCRWNKCDYRKLVWQDELIAKSFINPLIKYFRMRFSSEPNTSPSIIKSLTIPTRQLILQPLAQGLVKKIRNNYLQKHVQVFITNNVSIALNLIMKEAESNHKNIKETITSNSNLDNVNSYYPSITVSYKPIVIVSWENKAELWQKSIHKNCRGLSLLSFRGSITNLLTIQNKNLLYKNVDRQPRFHVIIITYQAMNSKFAKYLFNHSFIQRPQIAILDQQIPKEYINSLSMLKFTSKMMYIINQDSQQKAQYEKNIIYKHGQRNVIHFTASNQQLSESICNESKKELIKKTVNCIINIDSLKYRFNCPFNQLQRICFLRFILSFGLNFDHIEGLYAHLAKMNPGTFNQNNDKDLEGCQEYLKKLLALLYEYRNSIIDRKYIEFYLLGFERPQVYKRICQLAKLKKVIKANQNNPNNFPMEKNFEVIIAGGVFKFTQWNATEDYILASLIIDRGFGNWESILESRNWQIYKPSVQESQPITYRQYIKSILYDQRKRLLVSPNLLIEERSCYYLKLMK